MASDDSGHGGARTPSKPAAVSGPGRLSKRTDGGPKVMDLPNPDYGSQQQFHADQTAAPMGAPSGGPAAATPTAGPPPGFGGPSGRPDEDVSTGAELGPGIGPEALGLDQKSMQDGDAERMRPYLPVLIFQANRPEATQQFRNAVRELRARLR